MSVCKLESYMKYDDICLYAIILYLQTSSTYLP